MTSATDSAPSGPAGGGNDPLEVLNYRLARIRAHAAVVDSNRELDELLKGIELVPVIFARSDDEIDIAALQRAKAKVNSHLPYRSYLHSRDPLQLRIPELPALAFPSHADEHENNTTSFLQPSSFSWQGNDAVTNSPTRLDRTIEEGEEEEEDLRSSTNFTKHATTPQDEAMLRLSSLLEDSLHDDDTSSSTYVPVWDRLYRDARERQERRLVALQQSRRAEAYAYDAPTTTTASTATTTSTASTRLPVWERLYHDARQRQQRHGMESPTRSPTRSRYASPTRNQYASPTRNQYASPTRNQYVSPTRNQYASPTRNQYSSPTRNQYASPTRSGYTSPIRPRSILVEMSTDGGATMSTNARQRKRQIEQQQQHRREQAQQKEEALPTRTNTASPCSLPTTPSTIDSSGSNSSSDVPVWDRLYRDAQQRREQQHKKEPDRRCLGVPAFERVVSPSLRYALPMRNARGRANTPNYQTPNARSSRHGTGPSTTNPRQQWTPRSRGSSRITAPWTSPKRSIQPHDENSNQYGAKHRTPSSRSKENDVFDRLYGQSKRHDLPRKTGVGDGGRVAPLPRWRSPTVTPPKGQPVTTTDRTPTISPPSAGGSRSLEPSPALGRCTRRSDRGGATQSRRTRSSREKQRAFWASPPSRLGPAASHAPRAETSPLLILRNAGFWSARLQAQRQRERTEQQEQQEEAMRKRKQKLQQAQRTQQQQHPPPPVQWIMHPVVLPTLNKYEEAVQILQRWWRRRRRRLKR